MNEIGKILRFELPESKTVKPIHLLAQDYFARPFPGAGQTPIGANVIPIHSASRLRQNRQQ